MFVLFFGRHTGRPRRYTNMAVHTGLCKFVQNISTIIWNIKGKRRDLNLGEACSLFISCNLISWLYPVNGFRFTSFIVTVKTIYSLGRKKMHVIQFSFALLILFDTLQINLHTLLRYGRQVILLLKAFNVFLFKIATD